MKLVEIMVPSWVGAGLGGTLTCLCFATTALADPGWKVEKEGDGIEISSRSRAGSAFNELRGKATFDAPPEALLPLFRDADSYSSWLAECKESEAVGTRHGPYDFSLYAVIGIPWPFEDRDTVAKAKIRRLPEGKGYVVFLRKSDDSLKSPQNGRVRLAAFEGRWLLTPVAGGRTQAEFRIYIEPSGSLTPVFVNGTAASIQFKTFKNVRDRLAKRNAAPAVSDVPELGLLDPAVEP